jgi:hypothetical protein
MGNLRQAIDQLQAKPVKPPKIQIPRFAQGDGGPSRGLAELKAPQIQKRGA